ncbi:hypothetical protein D3C72_1271120 [compost metagenome]
MPPSATVGVADRVRKVVSSESGPSVTVVLIAVLSRVSFSNFHASAPLTESIALTTG